ncbi:MAG: hypothetical protein AB7O47_04980 [Flavobacteriales bacterium]
MRGYLLIILVFVLSVNRVNAQNNDKKIDELVFLYVDEKYDKVIDKAMSLTQNDAYKKHPLPYLYVSMGYYQISRRPDKYPQGKGEEYNSALKDAQKYMYNFIKKDSKANEYYNDYLEYYDLLADTSNKLGQHYFLMEDYRKAAGAYKYAVKALPKDPILLLWQGICEMKSMNTVEGDKNILAALNSIDENFKPSEVTAGVLAHGMLIVNEYLSQKGDASNANKAKNLVEVFKKYDPDELDKLKMEQRKEKAKDDDRVMRKFYSDEDDSSDDIEK